MVEETILKSATKQSALQCPNWARLTIGGLPVAKKQLALIPNRCDGALDIMHKRYWRIPSFKLGRKLLGPISIGMYLKTLFLSEIPGERGTFGSYRLVYFQRTPDPCFFEASLKLA